jgi:hypothetical protein
LQTYQSTSNGPSTASSSSGSTTEQAKDKAKEQAQQAAGQARGALRGQVDQRSTDAGMRVNSFASDVRSVGEQLRDQGKDQPAKLAEQAADRAERLGSYLRDSDADRILHDVEDFGRRQPWAVIAGGVAIGLVASRFLKASSSSRYESRFRSGYETSGRLPARTSDVSLQSGLGTTGAGYAGTSSGTAGTGYSGVGTGAATTGVGTTGAATTEDLVTGTGDLGRTGAGIGTADELGGTRDLGTADELGGTRDLGTAGATERGLDEPARGTGAENVSLTGGVLPADAPGATDPRRRDEGIR